MQRCTEQCAARRYPTHGMAGFWRNAEKIGETAAIFVFEFEDSKNSRDEAIDRLERVNR